MDNEIVEKLLSSKYPSVRYEALTALEGRPEDDPAVVQAKRAVMSEGPVPAILGKQNPGGYWGQPEDFYVRSKYKGTVWNMILLADLYADGGDPRIRSMCEFLLSASYDRTSGGFAYSGDTGGGRTDSIIPCLTGNMVWALIRFGYGGDPRVKQALDWMASYQRYDDGDGEVRAGSESFYRFEKCWGRHTCHQGVVKMLKAFAELPPEQRTEKIDAAITKGIEYILIHRIHKSSRNPERIAMKKWTELGFPNLWESDILEVLTILAKLGVRDSRTGDAVDLLLSKRLPNGWWTNGRSHRRMLAVNLEKDGQEGEWVTLRALSALNYYEMEK